MIRMVQLGIDHPHAAAYRGTLWSLRDRIEVVGFLAREGDATTPTGPFADVPVYHSLDDLLNATRPDAAQVMLRNNEMGPALTRLANEGIHLWVEKPLARRAADLAPVREIVRRKGLIFTAGYQNRFNPASVHVHDLVRAGLIGPLTFAHLMVADDDGAPARSGRAAGLLLRSRRSAAAASSTGSAAIWWTSCCTSPAIFRPP